MLVTEIITFIDDFFGDYLRYLEKLSKFKTAALAIEISNGDPQAGPTSRPHNPVLSELVGDMTYIFSERLEEVIDERLKAQGVDGAAIQVMIAEQATLRISVERLTAERNTLQKDLAARNERLGLSEEELRIRDQKIQELQKLNGELAAHLERILWLYDDLKRKETSTRSAPGSEQPQVMILSGPLSTIGMTAEEVTTLRERFSDDAIFRKNLTRAAMVRVHPDFISATLDSIHDPYLKQQIKFLQDERFKNIENAVDEIIAQLSAGKLENKWMHKKVK